MDALERTNLMLAKILEMAMNNGVSHWSLTFEDLKLGEEFETHFYPCIEWLEAEGLIRVGTYSRALGGLAKGGVRNISLSARGMAVLSQNVEIDGSKVPISNAVKKVSAGGVNYHSIGDAIGGVLGGFVKSLGG